ncbi:MAG: class III signal peptide-containing protein [Methanosphaera sp. rholeuAM130]|nr:class III signal peptide-containing protein [Methanosphaera sp.]RAP54342.1 MAG: class III signal peptide-containing protein [Methanosphaera sp. rholeuAM130]
MNILEDTHGQGAAEYILLFGGVIVIALVALQIYQGYFSQSSSFSAKDDAEQIRNNLTNKT